MGKKKERLDVSLPYRKGPPPMTDAERARLDALQRDTSDAQQLLAQWNKAREQAAQRAPDVYPDLRTP